MKGRQIEENMPRCVLFLCAPMPPPPRTPRSAGGAPQGREAPLKMFYLSKGKKEYSTVQMRLQNYSPLPLGEFRRLRGYVSRVVQHIKKRVKKYENST